ncbi:MAG: transglycosylase family protein [Actinomycetia bacterium]|nr:transglycosylase family protein [Actinomycetes bacterium]MCP4961218.1 transglycosylase family protein [Actinomycetes bacterium]
MWDTLAHCESSGRWSANTNNGYYGGIQFTAASWEWVGGSGLPHQASREEQIYRGALLWDIQTWAAWPGCTRKYGWSATQTSP